MANNAELLAQYLLLQHLLRQEAYDDVKEVVDVMVKELQNIKDGE